MLTIYTVYNKPKDFPDEFVVRIHTVSQSGQPSVRKDLFDRGPSIEFIRQKLTRLGLHNIGRFENDDPVIFECWI